MTRSRPEPAVLGRLGGLWATGLGSGLLPGLPGTWGSLAALLIALALPAEGRWAFLLAGILLASLGSVHLARRLPPTKALGGDPGWFVLDEWAGQWLAQLVVAGADWPWHLAAFVLFRTFDMTKPPPLRRLERIGAGFGILLDDLGAALYALLVLVITRALWTA